MEKRHRRLYTSFFTKPEKHLSGDFTPPYPSQPRWGFALPFKVVGPGQVDLRFRGGAWGLPFGFLEAGARELGV